MAIAYTLFCLTLAISCGGCLGMSTGAGSSEETHRDESVLRKQIIWNVIYSTVFFIFFRYGIY